MKILVPLVVCGFVLVGFFAVCLSVFLAPSDSYILDNVVTTTTRGTKIFILLSSR